MPLPLFDVHETVSWAVSLAHAHGQASHRPAQKAPRFSAAVDLLFCYFKQLFWKLEKNYFLLLQTDFVGEAGEGHVVERKGKGQSSGVQDFAGERRTGDTRSAAFCWRTVFWIKRESKAGLRRMMGELAA